MRKLRDFKSFAQDALIILGLVVFFTYMFRLWLLTFIALVAFSVVLIKRVCTKKTVEVKQEEQTPVNAQKRVTDADVFEMAYGVITSRVSELVEMEYPGAQWVWEKPNVRKLLQNGEEVFIRLNKAGGYRKAKVHICNLSVRALEIVPNQSEKTEPKPIEEPKKETDEPIKVNYELMAFDWVENHIAELNERCNNAIGEGKESLLLTAEELPVQESWANVCDELKRMGLTTVEAVPEGIKITLLQ